MPDVDLGAGLFPDLCASLGREVETAWADAAFATDHLPAIAERCLHASALAARFEFVTTLSALFDRARRLPPQFQTTFGDIQLSLYRSERLLIELLCWLDGTTKIHDHGFSGAFVVLQGESLHTTYRFDEAAGQSPELAVGVLRRAKAERLTSGDIRQIAPAPDFIHAVFHLATPTVTLVVRTPTTVSLRPQREYEFPGLARRTGEVSADLRKRIDIICALLSLAPDVAGQHLQLLAAEATAHEVFTLFASIRWAQVPTAAARQIEHTLKARPFGAALLAVLRETQLARRILQLRARTQDPRLRRTLGILANARGRAEILDLVGLWDEELSLADFLQDVAQIAAIDAKPFQVSPSLLLKLEAYLMAGATPCSDLADFLRVGLFARAFAA